MAGPHFTAPIARHIWDVKYRHREGEAVLDADVAASWHRVAEALTVGEGEQRALWRDRFYEVLEDFKFLPGGRIQAGSGTAHKVTLFNCFVMGVIGDSMDGIFEGLKEGALTMQQGGGVGYDFSSLRPRGTRAYSVGTVASGPVSFMGIWDSMCATILSTGARRGAMMGTLRCDHPDIEEFIDVKKDQIRLRHFNISVLVSDALMAAVEQDAEWPLLFPVDGHGAQGEVVMSPWPGREGAVPCEVHRRVRARELWEKIMHATYDYAEPGVLFVDRINQLNNLYYRERISASNPCGEVPLPPYGACNLGSVNLTQFVREPFSPRARLDMEAIAGTAAVAVRLLDNVIDVSQFPLAKQARQARGTRRIGLGLTGLADALMMLGIGYGSEESLQIARAVMEIICHTAYRTSIELARDKGSFPFLDKEKYLAGQFIAALPVDIRDGIAEHGIRNSHLTAVAPTGTISLLANNVSSGVEPVFDADFTRRVLELDGTYTEYAVVDYAVALWRGLSGSNKSLPPVFVDAHDLPPAAHLAMQAALQPCVDQAISKTINVPVDYDFGKFRDLYQQAYEQGLKGCTTFRPNPVTGEVLRAAEEEEAGPHCCGLEREAD